MALRHRFAPADLERVEDTVRRLGKHVTIAVSPTTLTLGGEIWRISTGLAGRGGYGEGHSLAAAIADLGEGLAEPLSPGAVEEREPLLEPALGDRPPAEQELTLVDRHGDEASPVGDAAPGQVLERAEVQPHAERITMRGDHEGAVRLNQGAVNPLIAMGASK